MSTDRRKVLAGIIAGAIAIVRPQFAQRVQGGRWLRISGVSGYAEFRPLGKAWRVALINDQLQRAGDRLQTANDAGVFLAIDSSIGTVRVGSSTSLSVRTLAITRSGARVTELDVLRGQVRVFARKFSNPQSALEIHTPAGVSRIRGTDFGISVDDSGKTAIATLSGAVSVTGQGVTVEVDQNMQTTVEPGEPPAVPSPLTNDPSAIIKGSIIRSIARLTGTTDPANLVKIEGKQVNISERGRFSVRIILGTASRDRVKIVILTPLGREKIYYFTR